MSRIEHQGDLLLSTLLATLRPWTGFSLLVRFGDGQTIEFSSVLEDLWGKSTRTMMRLPRIWRPSSSPPDITLATPTRRRVPYPCYRLRLANPFRSPAQRAAARDRLVHKDGTLRLIEALASKPTTAWSSAEQAAFPSMTNGVTDPPPQRASRWATLFAEELAEIHRLAASKQPLSDMELQEVLYLAGRLLSTVTDWPIDRIDDFSVG